jgi:predicted cupin superfamily sugar epimerase
MIPARWYACFVEADELIAKLGLKPLPIEGGYFAETYRSDETIPASALRIGRDKAVSSAIYYLLTPDTISRMHRLTSDEVFHFYAGDAVEMLMLSADGVSEVVTIGSDIEAGQRPQVVVPRGVWQGCRLTAGGEWALMGTTVAPAFDHEDFEPGDRADLIRRYPDRADLITNLTAGRDDYENTK